MTQALYVEEEFYVNEFKIGLTPAHHAGVVHKSAIWRRKQCNNFFLLCQLFSNYLCHGSQSLIL